MCMDLIKLCVHKLAAVGDVKINFYKLLITLDQSFQNKILIKNLFCFYVLCSLLSTVSSHEGLAQNRTLGDN